MGCCTNRRIGKAWSAKRSARLLWLQDQRWVRLMRWESEYVTRTGREWPFGGPPPGFRLPFTRDRR